MDRRQAEQWLSQYHDGELPSDDRAELEVHLESCPQCTAQLADIRSLSQAARNLASVRPPHDLWERIAAQLSAGPESASTLYDGLPEPTLEPFRQPTANPSPHRRLAGSLVIAAMMLVGVGVYRSFNPSHHHEPLEVYVQLFDSNPVAAQQQLAEKYSGKTVTTDEAVRLVGYRPRNLELPPAGFTCDKLVVLDMPCCKCVQAVWQREDLSYLAVFEHKSKMDDWFHDRPSVNINCRDQQCRVTDLNGQLAATWRIGERVITVIGLRNVEELSAIIAAIG